MALIHLTTFMEAPADRIFDLSRSVRLHRESMVKYNETIVEGATGGLMELEDTVTWKARHLLKNRTLKVKVTALKRPDFFIDEQVRGDFDFMKHEHYFKPVQNGTLMIDQFHYEPGGGTLGKLVNRIYLQKYLTRLLEERNAFIKKLAEGNQWQQFINT